LTVNYSEENSSGVWQTIIALSGACSYQQVIGEALRTNVIRSVPITLPASCLLGVGITVIVVAQDAWLQSDMSFQQAPLKLVDKKRPTIHAEFFPPHGGATSEQAGGDYVAGDSLRAFIELRDNHFVRWLVWEALPFSSRDSLFIGTTQFDSTIGIPLRPEWVEQPLAFRIFARDASGLSSDTITTTPGAIHVHAADASPIMASTANSGTSKLSINTKRQPLYFHRQAESLIVPRSTPTYGSDRTELKGTRLIFHLRPRWSSPASQRVGAPARSQQ
jgi:hypothetical protein